ncbi:MAG: tyrosine--tRNA ligase, partial [Bacilli bacterium]|nr:tyrosine--tRNA ligase [Bacilli bacterium]
KENCRIQLGGSDQWGNITSGAELIRRLDGDTNVVGITMPLITKSDGTKFGKSSGGSFWLDAEMTSPYTIYQYFLNTSDQDVIHYLKVFTFYSKEEIEEFANKVKNSPELREAQKALAKSLVIMLHGEKAMEEVQKMCDVLFGGNIKELSLKQINICFNGVPSISISEPKNIIDALVEVKAASSKREARELLEKGTYSVNGDKITDANFAFNKQNAIENKVFIIRRGKKNYFMVEIS